MKDRFPLIALVLAVLAVAGGFFASRVGKRGGFADSLSTYRSGPDGARAIFLLAKEAGLPVARRTEDLRSIEGTGVLVLFGVEGDKPIREKKKEEKEDTKTLPTGLFVDWIGKDERKEVLRFVSEGGRLVYVYGSPQHLADDLSLSFTPGSTRAEIDLVPALPSRLTRGAQQVFAQVSGYVSSTRRSLPLLVDPHADGEAVAITMEWGKGRVVAVSAPDLATNRALGHGDNATFWASLLGGLSNGETIEFDEFHHGFSNSRSVAAWASRYGLQFAVLQLLFALVLLAASTRRFGRPLPRRGEALNLGADYLVAMARIYRQGGHRQHAVRRVLSGMNQAIGARFGVSGRITSDSVASAAERQGRKEVAAALRSLATEASSGPLSDGDVLRIARRVARLRQSVESAKN
jgi:hypothetical protein